MKTHTRDLRLPEGHHWPKKADVQKELNKLAKLTNAIKKGATITELEEITNENN